MSDADPRNQAYGTKAQRAALRVVFSQRLRAEMERRKWTLATLLREAGPHLPEGFKLSHSHLWHYLRGKALPHAEVRRALSQALGTDLDQAEGDAPEPAAPPEGDAADEASGDRRLLVEDLGGGFARLRFDQELPWPLVIQILDIIKGQREG